MIKYSGGHRAQLALPARQWIHKWNSIISLEKLETFSSSIFYLFMYWLFGYNFWASMKKIILHWIFASIVNKQLLDKWNRKIFWAVFFFETDSCHPDLMPIQYIVKYFFSMLASKFRNFHISWKLINGYDLQSKKVARIANVFVRRYGNSAGYWSFSLRSVQSYISKHKFMRVSSIKIIS